MTRTRRHIALVNTAAPDRPTGSMVRYAQTVLDALVGHCHEDCTVTRVDLAPTHRSLHRFPVAIQTVMRYLIIALRARYRLPRTRATLFHFLDGSHAYALACMARIPWPTMVTIHDMIPALRLRGALDGERPSHAGAYLIRRALRGLARADVVVADSSNTRSDAIRLAHLDPLRVRVVPLPVRTPSETAGTGTRFAGEHPYLLHVAGNNTFYKNRVGVVNIFRAVRRDRNVTLKMVGAPPDAALRKAAAASGVRNAIEFLPDVSENELSVLYRGAALLLFPSLYEGFGWPPLEAMSHGCPVVCSNAASLPEIVGDAALTAPPNDTAALTAHCLRVLDDQALRARLVEAGLLNVNRFSMAAMASGLLKAYEATEVVSLSSHHAPSR